MHANRMRRCTGFSPSRTSGMRAPDDHAHRVIEVRRAHLVLDRDGDFSVPGWCLGAASCGALSSTRSEAKAALDGARFSAGNRREERWSRPPVARSGRGARLDRPLACLARRARAPVSTSRREAGRGETTSVDQARHASRAIGAPQKKLPIVNSKSLSLLVGERLEAGSPTRSAAARAARTSGCRSRVDVRT